MKVALFSPDFSRGGLAAVLYTWQLGRIVASLESLPRGVYILFYSSVHIQRTLCTIVGGPCQPMVIGTHSVPTGTSSLRCSEERNFIQWKTAQSVIQHFCKNNLAMRWPWGQAPFWLDLPCTSLVCSALLCVGLLCTSLVCSFLCQFTLLW